MYRQAAVAGAFYPAEADSVRAFIKANETEELKERAAGVLVPHAGYIYSGGTAVRTLSSVIIPDTVVLAGPNHTGVGPAVSVYPGGEWGTPLGDVPIASEIVDELCADRLFRKDATAHMQEHSLEVILPMLRYFNPQVRVVCITVKYLDIADIKRAAAHIAGCTDDALFVVSSDFNHFESVKVTQEKDKVALDMLMKMDAEGLYWTVAEKQISMCGVIPACIGIEYCRIKNAVTPVFMEHTHSGVVNGDNSRVVGYAGLYYKYEEQYEG